MTVRTTHVGQFSDERADRIAARLEDAGIVWWFKQSGSIARAVFAGDWGTHLFVDEDRLEEARAIIAGVPETPPADNDGAHLPTPDPD